MPNTKSGLNELDFEITSVSTTKSATGDSMNLYGEEEQGIGNMKPQAYTLTLIHTHTHTTQYMNTNAHKHTDITQHHKAQHAHIHTMQI